MFIVWVFALFASFFSGAPFYWGVSDCRIFSSALAPQAVIKDDKQDLYICGFTCKLFSSESSIRFEHVSIQSMFHESGPHVHNSVAIVTELFLHTAALQSQARHTRQIVVVVVVIVLVVVVVASVAIAE